MSQHYNKKIIEIFNDPNVFGLKFRKTEGDIGIELEVEGQGLPRGVRNQTAYWRDEQDHSLRGESNEYILTVPLPKELVKTALDEIRNLFLKQKSVIVQSNNTSSHIHLNCQQLTFRQVLNIAVTYYCLEDLLLEFCGGERQGNKFCLKAMDAEDTIEILREVAGEGKYIRLANDNIRYASLNLVSLSKYGSLEFRGLRGVTLEDWPILEEWVDIIFQLKEFALSRKTPADIIFDLSQLSPRDFIRTVFPRSHAVFLQMEDFTHRVKEGVRLAQDLAFNCDWQDDPPKAKVTRDTESTVKKKKVVRPRPLDMEIAPIDWEPQPRPAQPPQPIWRGLQPVRPVHINQEERNEIMQRLQRQWDEHMRLQEARNRNGG